MVTPVGRVGVGTCERSAYICTRDAPIRSMYLILCLILFTHLHTPHTHTAHHTHACTHAHMHTNHAHTHTSHHTPHSSEMMSEEDLLQLHSALTEGLSRVIKFLLVISEKDHPPEELVRCLYLHILLVLE